MVSPAKKRSKGSKARGGKALNGIAHLEILRDHSQPQRPIMLGIVIPDVEPVRDRLAVQDARKFHIGIQTNIPVRRSQDNLHLPVVAQKPVVGQIGHEVWRIVEVAIVVVVAVKELMDVERAAHAYAVSHDVRVLERKIHAVVTAEAASSDAQLPRLIFPANEWQELVQQVALVLQVTQHTQARMHSLVVPALGVHSIGAEDLYLAPLNLRCECANHASVLIFEELSHRCWEDEQGHPGMAEYERFHVAL